MRSDPQFERPWPLLRRNRTAVISGVVLVAAAAVASMSLVGPGVLGGTAQSDEPLLTSARRLMAHGKHDEAESLARSRGAANPEAAAMLARLAVRSGSYDEALSIVEPAARQQPAGEAALEYGLLLEFRGRSSEAEPVLVRVAEASPQGEGAATADAYLRAARAARALGEVEVANRLFRRASSARPGDPAIETAWGEMLAEKYQWGEASRSFQMALEKDPEWAPAHLGMATVLAAEDRPRAIAAASRALKIDPTLAAAHLFLAEAALDADEPGEARKAIDRALAINPHDPDAHALLAALAHLDGRKEDFDRAVAKVASVNARSGDAYRVAAAHAARAYRFDEAVALARKAVEIEPDDSEAHADLGMHLMRAGDEEKARASLERAWEEDRHYNVLTFNLLQLLDTLDKFESVQSGDAVVRMHPDEFAVLRHYAVPLVEKAVKDMGARYGLEPRGPILVEIFPKHDDFAVRTLGLPGLLGALGACFGRVVTLDSPRARPPGDFNWQATLWHEMAHVFSLQLSNQRVPRWLTEGISVYEEGRARPEWPREYEVQFASAYGAGKAMKLADLSGAFTRMETVSLAYFQSYLAVEMLVERYGEGGLRRLLAAYGEGLNTDAALGKALKTTLGEMQRDYDGRLRERFGALAEALKVPEGADIGGRERSPEEWKALAARFQRSYPVQLAAGAALAAAGDREAALAALERAASLVPLAAGEGNPRGRLAGLAEASGDKARAVAELKKLVAYDHTNIEAARRLARLAGETHDEEARLLALESIVTLDPFDSSAHTGLGKIALARRDLPVALREFRAAVDSGPIDVVSARSDLAEAFFQAGQFDEARREVLAALEIAPTYARAQELLLKIVDRK
ncbi:MAG: tetratricopeptide repeat protein [Vicinamibacterales bacterium]